MAFFRAPPPPPPPEEKTEYEREYEELREKALRIRARLAEEVAERLGMDYRVLTFIPQDLVAAALLLGIKVGN